MLKAKKLNLEQLYKWLNPLSIIVISNCGLFAKWLCIIDNKNRNMEVNFSSNRRNISLKLKICIILVIVLFGCNQNESINRSEIWTEDLDNFSYYLPKLHKNLYFNISEKEFKQRINTLKSQFDSLSEKEILFSLMKIISSVGDAHTTIYSESWDFNFLPIYTVFCDDGLLAVGTAEKYKFLIGKKILKINDTDIEEIQDTLKAFVSYENEFWLKYKLPEIIVNADLLKFTHIIDSLNTIKITYLDNGSPKEKSIIPVKSNNLSFIKMIFYYEYFNIELPISMRPDNKIYWFHYFENEQTVYFQYNQCVNMPLESFSYFTENLFKFISQNPVRAIIVDVRVNTGGNSNLFSTFFSQKLNSFIRGKNLDTYTLLSRMTFSSGNWAALEMKNKFNSILIGEPSGNKPKHYGDQRTFTLPNSKLQVNYSVKYWDFTDSDADAIYPDILIKIEVKDILAGRDKCLEKAFELINSSASKIQTK